MRAFETDEFTGLRAPVEVRASFRERLTLSRQAGELFGQYEDQLKHCITALYYSRSAINIRFPRNPYLLTRWLQSIRKDTTRSSACSMCKRLLQNCAIKPVGRGSLGSSVGFLKT